MGVNPTNTFTRMIFLLFGTSELASGIQKNKREEREEKKGRE